MSRVFLKKMKKKQLGYRFTQEIIDFLSKRSEKTGITQAEIMTSAIELLAEVDYDLIVKLAAEWGLKEGRLNCYNITQVSASQ